MTELSRPTDDALDRGSDVDERLYQPTLLWGYFMNWIRQTEMTERRIDVGTADPSLMIFRRSETGAYYMFDTRLYWKEDLAGEHFNNCDQDALWEKSEDLGEVQGYIYRNDPMTNPVQWNTFEDFIQEICSKTAK